MISMELSADQQKALSALLKWFGDPKREQFITLGGYAGTGKTSLISVFKTHLTKTDKKMKIAFCSYTGRAAQNLKNKLVEQNALMALSVAHRGYVLQTGKLVLQDTAENLQKNEMVQKAYLGLE